MPKAAKQTTARKLKSRTNDPAFAALDGLRQAAESFFATCRAEEAGEVCACELARASEAEARASHRLARTRPTTIAGAAAILDYIVAEPVMGIFGAGEHDWHEPALRTVAAALKKIARKR
jgi:hypothetical protein